MKLDSTSGSELQPALAEALVMLEKGKISAAGRRLAILSSQHPSSAECWTLLGRANLLLGQREAAEEALQKAIEVDKAFIGSYLLLAQVYLAEDRLTDAESVLGQAEQGAPQGLELLSTLGELRLKQGDDLAALSLATLALDLAPDHLRTRQIRGQAELQLADIGAAITTFSALCKDHADDAFSHRMLGITFSQAGDLSKASFHLSHAAEIAPQELSNHLELIRHGLQNQDWQAAKKASQAALRHFPDSVVLTECLKAIDDRINATAPDLSQADMERMSWDAIQDYGIRLQHQGRFEDSIAVLKQSLSMEPIQGMGYYRLAEAKCFEIEGRSMTEPMLRVYENASLIPEGRTFLNFALGKTFERERKYEEAMRYYIEGNDLCYELLRRSHKFFDVEIHSSYVEGMKDLYSKELMDSVITDDSKADVPIFIIGMIRSGTTLLDQIVSSHSKVRAAGEQEFWKEEGIRILDKWFNQGIDRRDLGRLREDYLFVLRACVGDVPHITDKMPLNYEHVGLIHMAFPNARFLHIRRNPMDTCLSIYLTLFGSGPPWTYNRKDIVAFYRAYRNFMDHWRSVIPADRMLELDYEEMVTNPEDTTRRVLSFCGLPWEEQCLRHEANPGFVKTPSRWQARQPMYNNSIDRWKRYEPWLGQLLELCDLIES